MGNQIQVVDTSIKSQPDLTVLKTMAKPVVVVYKLLVDSAGVRKPGKDQLVVNHATDMTMNAMLALQDSLPDTRLHAKGGPGTYRFEVTDQETSAKEVWQIRLGIGGSETGAVDPNAIDRPGGVAAAATMSAKPATAPVVRGPAVVPAMPPVPMSSDSEDLGNGFVFNSRYRILTVPDGRAFNWEPGQPLPKLAVSEVANPAASSTFTSMFPSAPVASAVSPELIELRTRNDALAAELVKAREVEQERSRREEIAALRTAHEKQIADLTLQMREFTERVTATPKEDPRIANLERQLAERERDATRDREIAALRTDFAAQTANLANSIREGQANRGPDPMMIGLLDYLKTQLANAQSSVLTPEKMLSLQRDLTERLKDSTASPLNEKIIGLMGGLLDMTLRFREASANLEGRGGGIDWSSILQTVVDRGGTAVAQISQALSRKAQAETARANATAVAAQRDMRVIEVRQQLAADAPSPAAPKPAVQLVPPTGEAARDALAERMFPKTAVSTEPAAVVSAVTEPAPAAIVEPRPVSTDKPQKRGRKGAAVPKEVDVFRTLPIEQIREHFGAKSDEEFFGPFMEAVSELRTSIDGDTNTEPLSPDDVAQYVLDAREFLKEAIEQNAGKPPLVTDFLVHGRYDYLFERLVPDAGPKFWQEAAEALQIKRAAEKAAQAVG
jgi:hypothetical protein